LEPALRAFGMFITGIHSIPSFTQRTLDSDVFPFLFADRKEVFPLRSSDRLLSGGVTHESRVDSSWFALERRFLAVRTH